MARITLIHPPYTYLKDSLRLFHDEMPSIGLGYLASALLSQGHEVTLVDGMGDGLGDYYDVTDWPYIFHGLSLDEIARRIPKDTQIVGISTMFSNEWTFHKAILAAIRRQHPHVLIALGGEHATADHRFILEQNAGVDLCVLGEGEETICEVAQCLSERRDWRACDGIAYGREGRVIINPRRKRMKDFSQLRPAWHLFPIDQYLRAKTGMNVVNRGCLPMLATRGCPHSCSFCSSPQMWGFKYTVREPADIVDEMRAWKARYPAVEHFVFVDLTMTLKKEWTLEFARRLADARLGVSWSFGPGTRTEVMIPEVIDALKISGLTKIGFASESGSAETLKKVNKRINLGNMAKSMRYANRINLTSKATVIYGFPGQTLRECFQNLFFALKLGWNGVDELSVYAFSPYPGSELHEQLLRESKIPDKHTNPDAYVRFLDQIPFLGGNNLSWSEQLDSRWLKPFFFATHILFLASAYLLHPRKIWNLIQRVKREKPITAFESLVYAQLRGGPMRRGLRPRRKVALGISLGPSPSGVLVVGSQAPLGAEAPMVGNGKSVGLFADVQQ